MMQVPRRIQRVAADQLANNINNVDGACTRGFKVALTRTINSYAKSQAS